MYHGFKEYGIIKVKVKCFNDACDNVLEHEYPLDAGSPRIEGNCPKCGKGYSKKVYNIGEEYIVEKN
ncbi:hypothetical protein ASL14_26425 (plasmid) [Paenibacillus sp. IHB B 3084]|uniref:hypothetical protein n=1 Tax=Paenibacillus sp. IHB B 3084 TaxID=867076 RepID=UPI00072200B9|nr:hypothetical protein [Paenibacillus sp. IHB B 3084]ALP39413.1 hypothetical protein ASL14_26425 [Paenibacillus sp. IHB B 3084]